ncbi:hypothetical protein CG736_00735 [Kitasatospora sp. CB02891]|nr:hypothetical protein CG736_00735 [Kitasatospora sp. CB02891]
MHPGGAPADGARPVFRPRHDSPDFAGPDCTGPGFDTGVRRPASDRNEPKETREVTRRRIAAALSTVTLAALLAVQGPAATAAPTAAPVRPQAVAQSAGAAAAVAQAVGHAPAAAVGHLAAGDRQEKKKGGFFKKLGIAVLVVIVLLVLLAIGLVVALVLGIRALFRRRRAT